MSIYSQNDCVVEYDSLEWMKSPSRSFECGFEILSQNEINLYTITAVKVNFHFIKSGSNPNAVPHNSNGWEYNGILAIDSILSEANRKFKTFKSSGYYGSDDFIGDSKIKLVLYHDKANPNDLFGGIWFWESLGDYNDFIATNSAPVINVRMLSISNNTNYWGAACGIGPVTCSTITLYNWQNNIANYNWPYWKFGRLLAHEVGHMLNLSHSFYCGNECSGIDIDPVFECNQYPNCYNHPGTAPTNCSAWDNHMHNLMGYNDTRQSLTKCQWGVMMELVHNNQRVFIDNCYFNEDDADITGSNETWDGPMVINRNLTIKSGSKLTITCEVRMGDDKKIYIEPGGKLIVDGGKITNLCMNFWGGIEVWGNSHLNQWTPANQGNVELKNGAIIEYAKDAISLIKIGDISTTGGIVNSNNATFRNNKRSVQFMKYDFNSNSSFLNTTFIVDDDFLEWQDFNTHVTMWAVRGVKFYGCRFINEMSNALFDESHNKGIYSIDAGYFIHALCDAPGIYSPPCPQQYLIPSEFRGFSYAVHASTSSTNKAVSIDQTEFENNYFGAVFDRLKSFRVVRSELLIGGSSLTDPQPIARHQKGLFSIQNTRFTIEDNLLIGAQVNNPSVGIRIDDAEEVYSRTYNNNLEHLYIGHKLRGYNRHQNGSDKGFQTICNRHHNNSEGNHEHDILIEQYDNIDMHGILQFQGSKNPEISSGTTFSHTGTNSYSDVHNLSNWHLDFFHTDGNTKPIYYNTEVEEKLVDIAHSCPSNFSGKYSEHQVMSISERNAWLDLYDDVELDYADLLYNYEQLKDGGSTSDLIDRIQSTWPQEAWDLYDDLMAQSPFLSEQVLIETADQDVLPVALYFEICLANPDASKNSNFLHYIEFEAPSPLPGYMVEIIRENRDSITLRSLMEMSMIDKSAELSSIANLMLTEYQLDTIIDLDKIYYWISRPNNLHDRYALIESFIEEGDFANAFNFYNGIDNDFDLRDQLETAYNEIGDYIQFRELIYLDNRTIAELDSMEQLELEIMAATYIGHTHRFAANILCFFYDNCQYIPIPPNQQSHRPAHSTKQEIAADLVIQQLKVYPIPAQAFTTFSWEFEELNGTADLLIYNANGQLVASRPITDRIGQWVLDTRVKSNGIYLYYLASGDKILASGQFIIQN